LASLNYLLRQRVAPWLRLVFFIACDKYLLDMLSLAFLEPRRVIFCHGGA
jgi:hypothetical protein